ncbi:MFS transporter [Nocardioides solisilvae]|uniref:MFS transporter n=1 Tax=Nocardioides solisilvae TaxID=1542435 RepID=UPI000D74A3F9|nr:MFS transporter [Nocardioides solisilvae]
MTRLLDTLVPRRLGRDFRRLLASVWASNVGDGIALAAGPLLVAQQTDDARLVALAAALQRVPWLLLGLYAGVVADRLDRRHVVVVANLLRALVLGVLCLTVVTGHVGIAVVLAAMLALGLAEVFSDTTTSTLTPMVVAGPDLGTANSRLQAGYLVGNQLVGPPLGAFLFAAGTAWPFLVQATTVLLAAVLVSRIAAARGAVREPGGTAVRHDVAEGVRWLRRHAAMRTLALVVCAFNVTWGAAWSVLVLWSLHRVGMGEVGYGLLTTAAAVGGLVGTATYGWLERHLDAATLMRGCLLLEVLVHLALALTTTGWVALLVMVAFGGYSFVWYNVSVSVRQRAVPTELQGRVGSVYLVAVFAGMVVGQLLGGAIAERWGLAAPFWFAFAGSAVTLALVWRTLAHVAAADRPPGSRPAGGRAGRVTAVEP